VIVYYKAYSRDCIFLPVCSHAIGSCEEVVVPQYFEIVDVADETIDNGDGEIEVLLLGYDKNSKEVFELWFARISEAVLYAEQTFGLERRKWYQQTENKFI
jgi:hypothetical protein